jgi:hypothetical protein
MNGLLPEDRRRNEAGRTFDVEIRVLRSRNGRSPGEVRGRLEDIGKTGISLESTTELHVGTRVALRVMCESSTRASRDVECFAAAGVIRRVGRRNEDGHFLLGVEFAAKPCSPA